MNSLSDWGEVFKTSFLEIWFNFVQYVPRILGAIIIFIVGIVISKALGKMVEKVLKAIYLDRAMETTGVKRFLVKVGFKIEMSRALGLLTTWFLYVVVLVATADMLDLQQITQFLSDLARYIPNIVVAIIILIVGMLAGNFVHTLIKETAVAADLKMADILANVGKWAIIVLTVMAALIHLRVAPELLQILFAGLVFMIALAGGIAFGLGGKESAREIIERIKQQ